MPLWGKLDSLAKAPKYIVRKAYFNAATAVSVSGNTISLVNSNTDFATGDEVLYDRNGGTAITGLSDGTKYYVRRTAAGVYELYDTQAHALAVGTTGRATLSVVGSGTQILQKTQGYANANDHVYPNKVIYFVSREEALQPENRLRGMREPGWWLYSTHTDGQGHVRHKAEHLVAMDVTQAVAGDSADDAVLVDATILISVQPESDTQYEPAGTTFVTDAAVSGTSVSETVAYQWQTSTNGTNWSDLSNAGVYSDVNTDTLAISATTNLNGRLYRAKVTAAGATTVYSSAATLAVNQITIGTQPSNVTNAADPFTGSFTVAATITGTSTLTYQWETSTNASNWTTVTNGGVYTGATSTSLNLTGAAKSSYNGLSYRCIVDATDTLYTAKTSNTATLTYA